MADIGLAPTVPGIAWISQRPPLALRVLAAIVGVLALRASHGAAHRRRRGQQPIFNWLLYGYGVRWRILVCGPSAASARRRSARTVDPAAILLTVLPARDPPLHQ
jgi:uncharacterized membrane protein